MFKGNYIGMSFPLPQYDYCEEEKYVLYGTGEVARSYYSQLIEKVPKDSIAFFLDSMSKEKKIFDKIICKPSVIPQDKVNNYKYILCTFTSVVSMENELKQIGVIEENIIKSSKYTLDSFVQYPLSGNKVCIYPSVDRQVFKKIQKKICNYVLPELQIKMDIVLEEQTDYVSEVFRVLEDYESLEDYDLVLVWDKKRLQDEELCDLDYVFCIDDNFFQYIDIKILCWMDYKLSSSTEKELYDRISHRNYKSLFECKYKKSYVFGTGPSMEQGMEIYLKKEKNKNSVCKIVCNAAIYNEQFMNKLEPDIYVLSDSFFVDVDNRELICKIVNYVNNHNIYLCIPKFWMPIYIYKYKVNKERLIGFMEMKTEIFFPNDKCLELYSKAHNVITKYAIPIASALADEICISGCDGAKVEENGDMIYEHSADAQAVVRNTEVLNHYAFFEQIIQFGEEKGKKYHSITKSFIPVLQERMCVDIEL